MMHLQSQPLQSQPLQSQPLQSQPLPPQLRIAIDSCFKNIDLVEMVIDDALAREGLDEDARYWTSLALREGVANAIKHGNRQDPEKKVEVDMTLELGQATIRIADRGEGFDVDGVADPLDPATLAEMPSSGRGIFFMKKLMDAIDFTPRRGGGTLVTLRKRLA